MTEKAPDKQPTFEKAMERLETIVADMEGGRMSLETMMSAFEEGTRLVQVCTKKLNDVEKKIEILVKKGGEITTEPFEPPPEGKAAE